MSERSPGVNGRGAGRRAVGADGPEVALGVAQAEAVAAVVGVLELLDDLGASLPGPGVEPVDLGVAVPGQADGDRAGGAPRSRVAVRDEHVAGPPPQAGVR